MKTKHPRSLILLASLGLNLLLTHPALAQTFTTNSPLQVARWNHTATLLPSGLVLIAGGETANINGQVNSSTNSAELYDPGSGSSTLASPMHYAHFSHTATLLNNGLVLVVGGPNDAGNVTPFAELYDPIGDSWSDTGFLQTERTAFTATLLTNGSVLAVAGVDNNGNDLSSVELYNPTSGTWTNVAPLGYAADSHTATLLANGLVLVAGGSDAGIVLTNASLYNPANNSWTPTGSLKSPRTGHAAVLLPSGKVFAVGDGMGGSSAELYDPATGQWTNTTSMVNGRSYPTATLMTNGQVLVMGGDPGQTTAEVYDPATATWTTVPSLNIGRVFHTATLLANGNVVVAGGDAGTLGYFNGPALADVETFGQTNITVIPTLTFTAAPLSGRAPLNVQFTSPSVDSAGNAVTNWNWTFGDGATSTAQNPAHTYTDTGSYVPSLVAYSTNVIAPLSVYSPGAITVTNPVLNVTAIPASGAAPLTVQFTSPSVDSSGNAVTLWVWSFGDGAFSLAQNPSHTYNDLGAYHPNLLAQSTNVPGYLQIAGLGQINVTNPILNVMASPRTGLPPLTVQFTSPSVDSAGDMVTSWSWNFGDGTFSTAQNPSHIYTNTGAFSPSLTAHRVNATLPLTITGPGTIGVTTLSDAAFAGNLPGPVYSFTYNDFANTTSLQLNGSAARVTTSDGAELELTPPVANQAGSVFTAKPITLTTNAGFSTFFTFRFNAGGELGPDFHPADGITFIIQSDSCFDLGGLGGQLGYSGIPNSLAVEFDTYNNGSQFNTGDVDDNHVSIDINGLLQDFAEVPIQDPMNNGNIWYAWIDYSGVSKRLEVRLSESPVRPLTYVTAMTVDLPSILGDKNVYVGFGGGTGSGWNQQDILSWKFMALPTARFTSHYALTNVSPDFRLTNGVVLKRFTYKVNNVTYTNDYLFVENFTEEPDGSVDAVTDPESTPVIDDGDGSDDDETEDVAFMSEYVNPGGGGGSGSGSGRGIVAPTSTPPPDGTSFDQAYPGYIEADLQAIMEALGANPPPPTSPAQSQSPQQVQNQINALNQTMNDINAALQQQNTQGQVLVDNVGFSSSFKLGTLSVREQILIAPPLQLILLSPRTTGTNFGFNFLTVADQPYSVWSNTDLATNNWVVYTNFVGDGFPRTITAPAKNTLKAFYRLSSP